MTLMRKLKVTAGIAVVAVAAHAYESGAFAAPATAAGTAAHLAVHVSGGTLDCAGLEGLWEQAGGSRSTAFMAAEIAEAESGGRVSAENLNGGRSTDRGLWQINSVHGSLSTFDAYGNARAAVLISHDGTDWSPWVTYQAGAYRGRC